MKLNFRTIFIFVLMVIFTSSNVYAAPVKTDIDNIQIEISELLSLNWKLKSISNESDDVEKILEIENALNEKLFNINEQLKNYSEKNDTEILNVVMNEFESMDPFSKNFFYWNVISILIEYENNNERSTRYVTTRASEYLPGYGYTDWEYEYKLGNEIRSEYISSYWRSEKSVITKDKKSKFYIKMEVAGEYDQNVGSENLSAFKITGKAMFEINGKLEEYAECEMVTKENIETAVMVLYDKHKVWFEVYKGERGFWGNIKWWLDGECYEYHEFPGSTTVIVDPEIILNI